MTIAITPASFRPSDGKAVVGVCRQTLYRWANAGHIKVHKRGNMAFFVTSEVLGYITGLGDQLGDQVPKGE